MDMFKIGFSANTNDVTTDNNVIPTVTETKIKPSVVDVHFPHRHLTCTYYNDRFDLHKGDIVYVDGKLEGYKGVVVAISYSFKIKLSDYKRVVGVVDGNVKGEFFMMDSHFITFDPDALPKEKVYTWFMGLMPDKDDFVSGSDDSVFVLSDLEYSCVGQGIKSEGVELYEEGNVVYISLSGNRGYAIVEGSENYEVEFTCENGEVSNITCQCYGNGVCRHIYAVLLQLREILCDVEHLHKEKYNEHCYLAAVRKYDLWGYAIRGKSKGSIIL